MKKNILMSISCFLVCWFQISSANELEKNYTVNVSIADDEFNAKDVVRCETLTCCFEKLKRCRDGGDINVCNEQYEQCAASVQSYHGSVL